MTDYQKIIEEIKSNLTDDQDQNMKYLEEQLEKYKTHPHSEEIAKEILLMLCGDKPKIDIKNIIQDNDKGDFNSKVIEANDCLFKRDFTKAKSLINAFLEETLSLYKEDETTRYYSFNDIAEFYCALDLIDTTKKIVWISLRYDLAYKILAFIASEEHDFTKAREYLDKGAYYNPMNSGILFERAESYKMEKDIDNMFKTAKEIYKYIFNYYDLARYYRLLGYCYIEKDQLDVAYALYAISIYYENSQMAHNEIDYIKIKMGKPDYKMSTKEILDALAREQIAVTISYNNLAKLVQLARDEEITKKEPELVQKLSDTIVKMLSPIDETKDIEGLDLSKPKITSEDIFDDKKIILDETDKVRRQKNIEYLKQNNIPCMENLKIVPINCNTKLRDKKEVLDRAIVDYIVFSSAFFALEGKNDLILNFLGGMNQKYPIRKIISVNDNNFLRAMFEKKVSENGLENTSWLCEECATLLWALGLVEKPNLNAECDVDKLHTLFKDETYDALLEKSNLLSKEEIMTFADLVFRCQWAVDEASLNGKPLPNLNARVVEKNQLGLAWLLNWKIDSILKSVIHTKYEQSDLLFEFDISNRLDFSDVPSIQEPNSLFTLVDQSQTTIITLIDYGFGSQEMLDIQADKLKKEWIEAGDKIIGEYELSASNITGKIKQLISTVTVPNAPDMVMGKFGYCFVLGNHLVCLKCKTMDTTINYQDSNSIENSLPNSLTTGILFSIYDPSSTSINAPANVLAQMINYRLHAEQLDIPLLKDFEVQPTMTASIILFATNPVFAETLSSFGPLDPNETFEQSVSLINADKVKELIEASPLNNDKSLFFYEDYTNGTFNYKVYVEDGIRVLDGKERIMRRFIAYFVEPKFNDLYQLCMASTFFEVPTRVLKLGVVDLEHDTITQGLYSMLKYLMDNLKYKDMDTKPLDDKTNKDERIINSSEDLPQEKNIDIVDNDDANSLEKEVVINNEFDYSNILPTSDYISNLVQYCDNVYNDFLKLLAEDEKKNEPLKYEYKSYEYHRSFGEHFEIHIYEKAYNNITCKDYHSFMDAVNKGQLKAVRNLTIGLDLDYQRGTNANLIKHENSFTIIFRPYEIKFARKSNFKDADMDQIEEKINGILKEFPKANSIFCTK